MPTIPVLDAYQVAAAHITPSQGNGFGTSFGLILLYNAGAARRHKQVTEQGRLRIYPRQNPDGSGAAFSPTHSYFWG
jgi:hypothetical protein